GTGAPAPPRPRRGARAGGGARLAGAGGETALRGARWPRRPLPVRAAGAADDAAPLAPCQAPPPLRALRPPGARADARVGRVAGGLRPPPAGAGAAGAGGGPVRGRHLRG